MDSWIKRDNSKLQPSIFFTERSQNPVGVSSIATKDAMFHLVQSKTKSSNLIDHTIEKPGKLFDRPLETQFDHTVNHGCIVDIDPECEPLLPCLKVPEVERSQ